MDDNQKNNNSQYSADDIRKYLDGSLTAGEMYSLEKAALSDPFLADAIEGMQLSINAEDKNFFSEDVADLRKKLNEKIESKKRKTINIWWKIAAVLIVMITGIAVSFYLISNKKTDAVIVSKVESIPADTNKVTLKKTGMSEAAKLTVQPVPKHKKEELPRYAVPEVDKNYNAVAEIEGETKKVQEPEADTLAKALQGKAAGVATGNMIFDSSSMDEVVVVGYGAARKKRRVFPKDRERIVPKGGWQSFHEYIEINKLKNISDSSVHGTQEIGFSINDGGRPENIRIKVSISPEIDDLTVRLIMEGPSWEILKGSKRNVKLKIVY